MVTNYEKEAAAEHYKQAVEFLTRAQQTSVSAEYSRDEENRQFRETEATGFYLSAVVHAVLSVTDTLNGSRKASWP